MRVRFAITILAAMTFAERACALEDWGPVANHVQGGVIAVEVTAVCSGQDKATVWTNSGTAFLIAEDGKFLTAAHLFPTCDTFQTLLIEGELRPPLVAKTGPAQFRLLYRERTAKYDVAIIQTDAKNFSATVLPVEMARKGLGTPLAALGYPASGSMRFAAGYMSGEGAEATGMVDAIVEEGRTGASDSIGDIALNQCHSRCWCGVRVLR